MIYLLLTFLACHPIGTSTALNYGISDGLEITAYGNSWVVSDWRRNKEVIGQDGIQNWTRPDDVIRTYFKTEQTGTIRLALKTKSRSSTARIGVRIGNTSYEVWLDDQKDKLVEVGQFHIKTPGYHYIELKGLEKSGKTYGDIEAFLVDGPATENGLTYVKDDFYWGRRGPSVHLTYQEPENKDVEWFYNEITVPEGEDVIGSYFMANGFGEGYFGMQVNSSEERRILFSVWSPYNTQDPTKIPEGYKILLQKKGEGVYTGEFGNEGSGGQSYWRYNWSAGQTYRFLLRGVPVENNSTDYTAWFFAPELGRWKLIASFRRPHTHTWLTRPHSFLENFYTQTGYKSRMGYYTNQWIRDKRGQWHEMTKARFTADATARKGSRLDYAGGVDEGKFFMKNCGFFDETTTIDSWFERPATGKVPTIDLVNLPE
ncbi:DUF3472 domain-containing protein [Membranicola marinus]|uniref:DUF3472 domain-containing protein n=2 Tax=Membranihabitans marinus TaxID=1227546 RepID=A0A953LB90_9BACT|nr:DUF3472 domain-containing protein [Membranihabitans marinus]